MSSKPTMMDVSRASGLSVWTVSQVLNGKSGVTDKSRAAVQTAARDLGYVVNKAARDLKRNERSGIAVITASTENSYYTDMVQGIHRELHGVHHTAMVSDIASDGHYTQEAEDQTIQSILGGRPAGVISTLPLSTANLDLLRRWEVAVVFVDSPVDGAASVTTDNVQASHDLGAHLASHGYSSWLALMYPEHWPTRRYREEGLQSAAATHGATLTVIDTENDPGSATAALNQHLESGPSADAFIAGNNPLLRGMLVALSDRGIQIPRDAGVVAFDEFPWAPLMTPPITVIDEDARHIGRRATSLLLELIARRAASSGNTDFSTIYRPDDRQVTRATLTVRSSCGCSGTG